MTPTVASSVDLVVHLGIDANGVRRLLEVVAVHGRVEQGVIETEPVFLRDESGLRFSGGMPPHPERFRLAGIDVHALLEGR